MSIWKVLYAVVAFFVLVENCVARIHTLALSNDTRKFFPLSTFGFYKGGYLNVQIKQFRSYPSSETQVFGFSLDKTVSDAINPYLDNHQQKCILKEAILQDDDTIAVMYFTMDLKNREIRVNCSQHMQHLLIYHNASQLPTVTLGRTRLHGTDVFPQRQRRGWTDSALFASRGRVRRLAEEPDKKAVSEEKSSAVLPVEEKPPQETPVIKSHGKCSDLHLPIRVDEGKPRSYSTQFIIYVPEENEEGLYNLYFHSCPNYGETNDVSVSFEIKIEENNNGNYLSAGEMPLPALYFMMSVLFFLSGCFWVFILRKSKKEDVFKIHYLMSFLVYLKSLSLLFHGMNYHFIQIQGSHIETWAVLYYVTHLVKGAFLVITVVLIGTGWAFIKHILSDKDKKIFMIVIPLQVLANVAEIIIEESEEGEVEHTAWRGIFIMVDLLCCGAILFPVVWSIRHLQEASETDGKAAINLRKLKLFRHFYVMIVCYIYFSRIVVYLLRATVPFQYEWLDEMFREMATFVFYVLTGYKFRPASSNPYFQVPQQDDELDMDMVITQTGFTEGLSKINHTKTGKKAEIERIAEEDEEVDSALLLKRVVRNESEC